MAIDIGWSDGAAAASISVAVPWHPTRRRSLSPALLAVATTVLFVLNIVVLPLTGYLYYWMTLPSTHDWIVFGLLGVHLGQWFLLLFWMSFGTLRAPWRQLICTVLSLGSSAFLGRRLGVEFENWLFMCLVITSLLWAYYGVLHLVRRLSQIEFEFVQIRATTPRGRGRFSVGGILLMTSVFAIAFGLLQLAISIQVEFTVDVIVTIAIFFGGMQLILLPIALAMLASRRAWIWMGVAAIYFAAIATGVFMARRMIGTEALPMCLGLGLAVVLNLGTLRCLGVRWLPRAGASDEAASGGALVAAAV